MPGQRRGLGRDAFLDVTVGGDHVDLVVEQALALRRVRLEQAALAAGRHRHADRVADALAERAGGGLDAGGVPVLGVARGPAAPGPQRLQVVQLEAEAGQVELDVQGQAGVPRGQHEAVAAGPVRIRRVVPHHLLEQQVRRRREAHRRTGMSVADLLDRIHREHPYGVDRALVQFGPFKLWAGLLRHAAGAPLDDDLLAQEEPTVAGSFRCAPFDCLSTVQRIRLFPRYRRGVRELSYGAS